MKMYILFLFLFICQLVLGQTPQGFNYQAVIRDNSGKPKENTTISLKLSILDGSASGPVLYAESHNVQTNSLGLVNVVVGKGNVLAGNFSSMVWKKSKFLQVAVDNVVMGTSELQSVPFAHYAETTNLTAGNGIAISANTITNTGDLSNSNEIQTLSLSDNTLSLSNGGGSVILPAPSNNNMFQGKVSFFNADKSRESIFYDGNQENIVLNVGKAGGKIFLNTSVFGDVEIGNYSNTANFTVHCLSKFTAGVNFEAPSFFNSITFFNKGVDFKGGYAAFRDKSPKMFKRLQIYSNSSNLSSDEGGIEFINDEFNSAFIGMRDNSEMGVFGYGLNDWIMRFNINTGSICASSGITICSDERLKRNFSQLSTSLSSLNRIHGYHYYWKNDKQPALQTGFKAQDIQLVFPELVETDSEGMLSVNYIGFVPHLVEAVKTLSQENQILKEEKEQLVLLLSKLEKRIGKLEQQTILARN